MATAPLANLRRRSQDIEAVSKALGGSKCVGRSGLRGQSSARWGSCGRGSLMLPSRRGLFLRARCVNAPKVSSRTCRGERAFSLSFPLLTVVSPCPPPRAFIFLRSEAAWRALSEGQAACQLALHFFRQTLLYMTFEVIEPLWRTLEARLLSARALDDVVAEHTAFLRCLLKGCLLSRKVVVLRALLSLKDIALQFVRVSDRFLDVSADGPEDAEEESTRDKGRSHEAHTARAARAAKRQAALLAALGAPEYGEAVSSLRTKFAERMRAFMAELAEARRAAILDGIEPREELDGLSSLILRLDLNGRYHRDDAADASA